MLCDEVYSEDHWFVQISDDVEVVRKFLVVDLHFELKPTVDCEWFAVRGAKHR